MKRKVQRIVSSVLSMALLLCGSLLAAPAAAAGTSKTPDLSMVSTAEFIDWDNSQWWADRDSVKYAIGMGYIQGRKTADGTVFAGNEPVTVNEFLTVMARMKLSPQAIQEAQQGWINNHPGYTRMLSHWFMRDGYFVASYKFRYPQVYPYYYDPVEGCEIIKEGDQPCTRKRMAGILVYTYVETENQTIDVNGVEAVKFLNDYEAVKESGDDYSLIGIALGLGLITGDNNGNFDPQGTVNRASMCEVIYRLANLTASDGTTPRKQAIKQVFGENPVPCHQKYMVDPNDPQYGTPVNGPLNNQGVAPYEAITIDMSTPNVGHRCPHAGDTVIRPDGTSVVLKFDEKYGILGWGQNCDPWTGTISGYDGHLYRMGEWGGGYDLRAFRDKDYHEFKSQDHLMKCLVGGEATKWEAHWSNEFELVKADIWAKVESGEIPAPTYEGQVAADGYLKAVKSPWSGLQWMYMEHHKDK